MIDDLAPLRAPMKTLRIDIMDETPDEINEICKFYRQLWVNRNADYTFNVIVCLPN